MTDGYVVNNHADRFRPPRIGLWNPLQMAILWHIYIYVYIHKSYVYMGVTNHLPSGMILQGSITLIGSRGSL